MRPCVVYVILIRVGAYLSWGWIDRNVERRWTYKSHLRAQYESYLNFRFDCTR